MPKILSILIFYGIVISILLWTGMAGAATVSWDQDIVTDLAGFKIYVNGEMAKDVADPTARSAELFSFWLDGNNTVTMTAYDSAGQESLKSEPCIYNPAPISPVNVIIKAETVVININ